MAAEMRWCPLPAPPLMIREGEIGKAAMRMVRSIAADRRDVAAGSRGLDTCDVGQLEGA